MSKSKKIYGRFGAEHLSKMKQGVILFNQQKYWECHEILEEQWLEDRGDPARYVYWAVIQVACSMVHYLDNNLTGALGMLGKAKDKFSRCEEKGVETPLLYKNLSWDKLKKWVFEENYRQLYGFRFKDPLLWEY